MLARGARVSPGCGQPADCLKYRFPPLSAATAVRETLALRASRG